MCPGTIALVSSIAGAATTAAGAITGGIAQQSAANYQAQVASNNAIIAHQNAVSAAEAGGAQTTAAGLRARAKGAGVRAGIAASGIDVNSGSAVDVQQSEREIGALDTGTVASNAAKQVYGYQTQQGGYTAQAGLDRQEGEADVVGGVLKGAGTLLSNPAVDSFGSSLLSGAPSLPSNYKWMATPGANNSSDFANV